jgi:hypothetical protein
MASEAIDKKYLARLKYTGPAKGDNGEPTVKSRALQVGDVLDWKDNGATVTIVTADGQKHTVSKNAKAGDEEPKE